MSAPIKFHSRLLSLVGIAVLAIGCSSGGGSEGSAGGFGAESANFGCDGGCASQRLSAEDVTLILQQGVAAADALGVAATFAITDRVGNVLALYQMNGANPSTTVNGAIGAAGGLEGVTVPATIAAISKAGTGAYLSSQGNAFSTRTASQIIQEHFNPGETEQFAGPLFGVQFSQLACSDITTINPSLSSGIRTGAKLSVGGLVGPRPLPLGLSADPGGIPIYKLGDMVGGIGVELDGSYSLDRNINDYDDSSEERIALSAARNGFELPSERVGNQIFVAGKSLRTVDLSYDKLAPLPAALPDLSSSGALQSLTFYSNGTIRSGALFGEVESGVLRSNRAGVPAAFLVNASGAGRFPTRAGNSLGGAELKVNEVEALLDSAILTAFRLRAAIRTPRDSAARVSIFVVDHLGVVLGMVRNEDAPVFGLDVALQKARTAAFFSSADAGAKLSQVRAANGIGAFNDYVSSANALLGAEALSGRYAFSARAIGNIARPFIPDGIDGNSNGPLSLPFPGSDPSSARTWSPFNDGLQLDLVFQRLVQPLGIPQNPPAAVPDSCTDSSALGSRLRNGIQIFAGGVPLYRGTTLIGAIGVSGDGIDQDDMIAFYGASRPGLDAVGHSNLGDSTLGFNAPPAIRSDNLEISSLNIRLRYINCPEAAFRGDNEQQVCAGL